MWPALFAATNLVAVAGWLMLLAGPRRWLPAVEVGAIGLLCAIYVALAVLLTAGLVNPVRAAGPAPSLTDYSVRGLRALFASDGAIVVGWTHYLALDLLAGTWIAARADAAGWRR